MMREIMYAATSMRGTWRSVSAPWIRLKDDFAAMKTVTNTRKGAPVIKIADTLQSHLSATVGKVDCQGMKCMAPKRPITTMMAHIGGRPNPAGE